MAAGGDRYEPLREAARKAQERAEAARASQDENQADTRTHQADEQIAERALEADKVEELSPTRPEFVPHYGPSSHGLGENMQAPLSASQRVAEELQKREESEVVRSASSPEAGARESKEKVEQDKEQTATSEKTERKLKFFEDLHPEQSQERER